MIVTLDEAKEYLRVEYADEDTLLDDLLKAAHQICMDVARITDEADFGADMEQAKAAVMYTVAYLYEHREEADHHEPRARCKALKAAALV